jgi:hypothetical protein
VGQDGVALIVTRVRAGRPKKMFFCRQGQEHFILSIVS